MCVLYAQFEFAKEINMEIRTFGGGGRIRECERVLRGSLSGWPGRLILLTIPTSRDNKYITDDSAMLEDIIPLIDSETALVGYNIPPVLLDFADKAGAQVYDGGLDEDFLSANAELTARGALGYLLTHGERDLSELSVGVVGYGRIGSRLVRMLLLFGAKITLYTRRQSLAMELCEMGISALTPEEWDFSGLDMLINTAPARQIEEEKLPANLEILDLASGRVFEPSGRLTKLASIPDMMYPKTAGRLYAESAMARLWGDNL